MVIMDFFIRQVFEVYYFACDPCNLAFSEFFGNLTIVESLLFGCRIVFI